MIQQRKKITLVISSLDAGGAERVMSTMANYWAAKGWDVTILTFDGGREPPFYRLESNIRHKALGIAVLSAGVLSAIWNNLRRIVVLRCAIRESRPAVVISFMDRTNITTLLATMCTRTPVIVSERCNPAMYNMGAVLSLLRLITYSRAHRIVLQTDRVRNFFPSMLQKRITIIPNPVLLPAEADSPVPFEMKKPCVVAMGRFTEEKGFDLLLQAFARVKGQHPTWTLFILGEGPLRGQLEALRDRLGLAGRVFFPGRVSNPQVVLRQADIFVLSSRHEGFPNALCEAIVCGLPVIATDCPNGPREIIRDGVDGILIPTEDPEALAAALDRVMTDEKERQSLARRASEIVERFDLEKIMAMWEGCLK